MSCGNRKPPKTIIETIKLEPPLYLLSDCEEPYLEGKSWGDLAMLAIDLKTVIEECNEDKRALRKFYNPEESK